MGRSGCAIFGCIPSKESGRHRFVNPEKNLNLFNTWLHTTGNKELFKLDSLYIYRHYRICSTHFEDKYFTLNGTKTYLTQDAIPTKYLPDVCKENAVMDLCTPTILVECPHETENVCESIESTSSSEQAITTDSFILIEELPEDPQPVNRPDVIAIANRSDGIAIANRSDGIGITTISDGITIANSNDRKRKPENLMELEDFCEEDLKDPEKLHQYWLLSQNAIKTLTNSNRSLMWKMEQQIEDIKCLKALNRELKIQLSSL